MNFSLPCQIGPTKIALLREESFSANGFFLKIALAADVVIRYRNIKGGARFQREGLLEYLRDCTRNDRAQACAILKIFDTPYLVFFISAFSITLRGVAACVETEDADAPAQ